jgi:hypothetical protein
MKRSKQVLFSNLPDYSLPSRPSVSDKQVEYEGTLFTVSGSVIKLPIGRVALASEDDGKKGVFNLDTGSLLDGLFSPDQGVQLFFDEVNNLMSRSWVDQKERLAVIFGQAEPI